MADWEKLVYLSARAYPLIYLHDPENTRAQHFIRRDKTLGRSLCLADPELDALATKSEKVRALALIARECLALMRLRMAQDAGLGRDRVMERACDVLEKELAQFEEVANV